MYRTTILSNVGISPIVIGGGGGGNALFWNTVSALISKLFGRFFNCVISPAVGIRRSPLVR